MAGVMVKWCHILWAVNAFHIIYLSDIFLKEMSRQRDFND